MRLQNGKIIVTLTELAEILGWTKRWINIKVESSGFPGPIKRGEYDFVECVKWRFAYDENKIRQSKSEPTSLKESEERIAAADAEMKELKLQCARGELIEVNKASGLWGYIIIAVKRGMLALSNKIAPMIQGDQTMPEKKNIIDKAVYEVLNELSNPDLSKITGMEDDPEGDDIIQTASEIDHKPVGRYKPKVKRRIKRRARALAHRKGRVPAGNDGRGVRSGGGVRDVNDKLAGGKNGNFE